MAIKSPQASRNVPQQKRSRDMVTRIVDAGARVLNKVGYDGASTNRIAAEAGVSPGSLYYYFPDKDSIVSAVLERFVDGLWVVFSDPVSGVVRNPSANFELQVTRILDHLRANRPLLKVLINQAPRLGPGDARAAFDDRLLERFRLVFTMLGSPYEAEEFEARCWMAAQLCLTLPVRYVLSEPPISQEHFIAAMKSQLEVVAGVTIAAAPVGSEQPDPIGTGLLKTAD